ncbi:MAG: YfbM family protein [Fibrobacteria bacterium]|nr:YfbM family protein [Fibrobacteria bacterium]
MVANEFLTVPSITMEPRGAEEGNLMGMVACFAPIDNEVLSGLVADPSGMEGFLESVSDAVVDIDKSWHAIHFTLAGSSDGGEGPLASAVFGGIELGDDMGYGPVRYLDAERVRVIADRLTELGVEGFKARFSLDRLAEADIYPSGIWAAEGDEAAAYVFSFLPSFFGVYEECASKGRAILLWIA